MCKVSETAVWWSCESRRVTAIGYSPSSAHSVVSSPASVKELVQLGTAESKLKEKGGHPPMLLKLNVQVELTSQLRGEGALIVKSSEIVASATVFVVLAPAASDTWRAMVLE